LGVKEGVNSLRTWKKKPTGLSQGITYNAYINDLRINHFIDLYREAVAAQQPIVAQQLASDSGYRSYSTFSLAFKQRMGQSVTAWMRETAAT